MKVTTDGCLFGAIVANELTNKANCRMLDIGTGTGLLSLMVAQENDNAVIDAVEIEEAAARQAAENMVAAAFNDRIQVIQTNILHYKPAFPYDFIISNPPFHEQQLSSPVAGRQLAHHSSGLTLQQLFEQVAKMLKNGGKFLVLLPFYRMDETIALAATTGLFTEKQWLIRQTPKHSFFRAIFCFGQKKAASLQCSEIIIRNEANSYSAIFTELLQPFYLHL